MPNNDHSTEPNSLSNQPASSPQGFRVPNTFQCPNRLVDELLPELAGSELKVLLYIIRRTFGFSKDRDDISLSQMLYGITTNDGKVLDRGVGIRDKKTLLSALNSLEAKKLIITERRSSPEKGNQPTSYCLNILLVSPEALEGKIPPPLGGKSPQGVGGEIPPSPWGGNPPTQNPVKQNPVKQKEYPSNLRKTKKEKDETYVNQRLSLDSEEPSSPNGSGDDEERSEESEDPSNLRKRPPRTGPAKSPRREAPEEPPNPAVRLATDEMESAGDVLGKRYQRRSKADEEDYAIIMAFIQDVAHELHDQGPLNSSTTHAYNLMKRAGISRYAFMDTMYEARRITQERSATIRATATDKRTGFPLKNKMPYFFSVLAEKLGLKEEQATREK